VKWVKYTANGEEISEIVESEIKVDNASDSLQQVIYALGSILERFGFARKR
jgi:hypothetical protein